MSLTKNPNAAKDALDFSGKTVFVMGGTSGINRGIAEVFAAHGGRMAVASRSPEKVEATVERLASLGADAVGFSVDVRDAAGVKTVFEATHEQLGAIDVLISGAAGNFPAPALGMSPNGFKAVVDIDLLGTFHVMQAAYPYLTKPGASLINISAPQALMPAEGQIHVCAAKAGVDMVTRVLAMEWGPDGVRINSIVPGPIAGTEGMKRLAPTPSMEEAVTRSVPLRRYGTPQDIANMALVLSSTLASYVSGAVIPVDGGWALGGFSTLGTTLSELAKDAEG
jgi:NAD(P)-dependent dehydrogenase (short-subunit alcohol dehydrogenase family)